MALRATPQAGGIAPLEQSDREVSETTPVSSEFEESVEAVPPSEEMVMVLFPRAAWDAVLRMAAATGLGVGEVVGRALARFEQEAKRGT